MGLRDDVRERRRQKIKLLLDKYEDQTHNAPVEREKVEFPMDENAARNESFVKPDFRPKDDEGDPELAWKRNPNPWTTWDMGQSQRNAGYSLQETGEHLSRGPKGGGRFWKELKWKTGAAIVLFGCVWGMFQLDQEWSLKGQAFVKSALADEFDFASAAAWYKTTFAGAPSFIPLFQQDPARTASVSNGGGAFPMPPVKEGALLRTFAERLNGIELAAPSGSVVAAVDKGRIIFVTGNGDSVLIQHAGKVITVYGGLEGADVAVNDWVEAGDAIGKLPAAGESGVSLLYFSVKRDDRYIDPLEVISLD